MTNRKLGNQFEREFCNILYDHYFWVHNLAQSAAGQPADVIAAKRRASWLIDCKVCSAKGFSLSRLEENQQNSMWLWGERVQTEPAFALKLPNDEIYMVEYYQMVELQQRKVTFIKNDTIREIGKPLEQWIKEVSEECDY